MLFGRHGILPLIVGLPAAAGLSATANPIQFNRDVRPILSENCFVCHGHDKNHRKAKLQLDVRDVAIQRGAIVPGKPDGSKLVDHIFAENPDDRMPPPESGKVLTSEQKALLKEWIAAGAVYEPHWAYIHPNRPEVPRTKDTAWARNPIDAFILRGLEAKGVRPSPEADQRNLLRRLSLDLVGLPPTPEEVRAYVSDTKPSAYERQVDRLLDSPHYGERMAVPWLDLVRFADTVGYHGDQNQNDFPYRDYVIAAFNDNKPFDQFTVEQLAGDLLPNPSVKVRIATGFNRLNMMTREGGAQPKEYLAKYAADRVRTVSMAWLGSTMGCAECHDHKFDPFTSKDFYQMEAFFADVKQWGVYADYSYTPNEGLEGYGNDHPFPPEIQVDSPYLQRRIVKLTQATQAVYDAAAAKLKADKQRQAAFHEWCQASRNFLQQWPDGWAVPQPEVTLKMKDPQALPTTNFTVRADATTSLSDQPKAEVKVALELPSMWVSAIRLEVVPQATEAAKATAKKWKGTDLVVSASMRSAGKESKLPFQFGEADHKEERYSMGLPIIGVTDRWLISTREEHQTAVWLLDKPVQAKAGDALVVSLGDAAVASVRLSVTPFPTADPLQAGLGEPLREALGHTIGRRTTAGRDLLNRTFLLNTQWDAEAVAQARKLQGEIRECRGGRAFTMVTVAGKPALTRVLPRGNWQDESGEIVEPATPHFLPRLPGTENRRLTRLDLAHWLMSPGNPLTARAVMNRLWKQFFGTGISAVVDDLGAQGEWPTHPELLDWLACEFMQPAVNDEGQVLKGEGEQGKEANHRQDHAPNRPRKPAYPPHPWDFKHMVKLIVMSAAYRQDSNQRQGLKEIDPNNRLVACQMPRRLNAEFVRDNALEIAGLLNEEIGGPSAYPYQPAGYYANIQFPDRDYYPNTDERQYRRGLYTHWQRTFLHPMLANFDAPSREECSACRLVSNTPQQALTLLNDLTFVEAARALAARLLEAQRRGDEARLELAFERALARPPRAEERRSLLEFLAAQRAHYATDIDAAGKLEQVGNAPAPKNLGQAELAAWTQVCRVILNLQETITRY